MRRISRNLRDHQRRGDKTLGQKVAAILRKYGTDAHVYLPHIGVINGLTAGNYLDSAGTTAATVDNPVGLVLDAGGTVGAELVDTANTASAWTKYGSNTCEQEGDAIKITYVGGVNSEYGAYVRLNQAEGLSADLVVGKYYKFTCEAKINTGTASLRLWDGASALTSTGFTTSYLPFQFIFKAAGLSDIGFNADIGAGEIVWIKNISVKEVTGIHATQATTANKPILRRGAVNLLTYSEQFDNAAWNKNAITINANQSNAPDGTLTADRLTDNATSDLHVIRNNDPVGSATVHTFSVYLKYVTLRYANISVNTGAGYNDGFIIDLTTGLITQTVGSFDVLPSVILIGNGWYRVSFSKLLTTTSYMSIGGAPSATPLTTGRITYLGDGSGFDIWGAQLETGSTASTYIPTTTAAASSASGNYAWEFDGTNDNLKTSAASFGADMDVFILVNPASSGLQAIIHNTPGGANYLFCTDPADGVSPANVNSGTPTYKVNGVEVIGGASVKRVDLASAIGAGAWKVVEANNANMTDVSWVSLAIGTYGTGMPKISLGIVIVIPALSSSDRDIIRKYIGSLAGVSI